MIREGSTNTIFKNFPFGGQGCHRFFFFKYCFFNHSDRSCTTETCVSFGLNCLLFISCILDDFESFYFDGSQRWQQPKDVQFEPLRKIFLLEPSVKLRKKRKWVKQCLEKGALRVAEFFPYDGTMVKTLILIMRSTEGRNLRRDPLRL